jgi:phage terminase small subunit
MIAEEHEYGPAMAALNDRQQKFVLAMLLIPGCSHARAAREAGYSDVKEGAKVRGHYAAHNPKVQDAIREEARRRLDGLSVIAANVMMDAMLDPKVPTKDKLKAASAVLDRTGFAAVQKIDVTRKDESGVAVLDQIRRLAEKLGVPVQNLLSKPVVDAEFSEVGNE